MLAVVVQAAIRRHWQARLTWAAMAALSPVLATRIAPTTPVHKSNSTPRDVRSKTRRRSGTRRPRPSMCVVKLRDWLSGCHGLLTAFVTVRDLLLPGMCGCVGVWVWVWVCACASINSRSTCAVHHSYEPRAAAPPMLTPAPEVRLPPLPLLPPSVVKKMPARILYCKYLPLDKCPPTEYAMRVLSCSLSCEPLVLTW